MLNTTGAPSFRILNCATALPFVTETLPNGRRYDTVDLERDSPGDDYGPVRIPAGHVFLMGDNRDRSADSRFRLGGLVEKGSVIKKGETVEFKVTDLTASLPVTYTGVLPDLFREGQGVVAEGRLDPQGLFHASEVLAKHDEKYMPKEVADALKKSGHWQEGQVTK